MSWILKETGSTAVVYREENCRVAAHKSKISNDALQKHTKCFCGLVSFRVRLSFCAFLARIL